MVTSREHQDRILDDLTPLAPVRIPLAQAYGLVAATDVSSAIPLPVFDNSAMDGYAVHAADVTEATTLPVVGETAAGGAPQVLPPGAAMKIMTGAPIPAGADAVVPYEATDRGTKTVAINEPARSGAHIRRSGEDVAAGDVVVPAGTTLTARHLAVVAATGAPAIEVHPRPRVVIISTGDELRQPGEALTPGAIYDSNSILLAALVRQAGGLAETWTSDDDAKSLSVAVRLHEADADLMITTGGVSAGDYDVVKEALAPLGLWFGPVAMQPGKPQGYGRVDGVPLVALPGNPVSAYVSFALFVRPALRRLMGRTPELPEPVRASLSDPITSPAGKQQFLRATYADGIVSQVSGPGSHLIGALAAANALVVVPADVTALPTGAQVDVLLMED